MAVVNAGSNDRNSQEKPKGRSTRQQQGNACSSHGVNAGSNDRYSQERREPKGRSTRQREGNGYNAMM